MAKTETTKTNLKINYGTKDKIDVSQLQDGELLFFTDKGLPIPGVADDGKVVGVNNGGYVLENLIKIPACPTTTDGTYVLKATVASGVVTYSWVAE